MKKFEDLDLEQQEKFIELVELQERADEHIPAFKYAKEFTLISAILKFPNKTTNELAYIIHTLLK